MIISKVAGKMKLSLTQENLNKALGLVSRAVSGRSSLPVLSNVLLQAEANRLKLAATNLEVGITCWIGCRVDTPGSVTVPARLFSEFVTNLPNGNLELSSNDQILRVVTAHHQGSINGISAEEFPLIPEVKSEPVLVLPNEEFREALSQVVVAASLDEARPVLAGVYLHSSEQELVLAATDSYRLAEKKIRLKNAPKTELSIIVPAKTMQELSRVLADAEGELKVYRTEGQIMFQVGDVELTSRLIEGKFPNYQQIIPSSSETGIEIDTAEFSRVTKVANLFARENAGGIRLEIKAGGRVNLISAASQVGENVSSADCETEGDDGEISLNARYLSDVLGVIRSPKVNFSISGKLNPCVIRPVSGKKADQDYLHIIMPLRTT
jgi:DNA polymerase III subunit beta